MDKELKAIYDRMENLIDEMNHRLWMAEKAIENIQAKLRRVKYDDQRGD